MENDRKINVPRISFFTFKMLNHVNVSPTLKKKKSQFSCYKQNKERSHKRKPGSAQDAVGTVTSWLWTADSDPTSLPPKGQLLST